MLAKYIDESSFYEKLGLYSIGYFTIFIKTDKQNFLEFNQVEASTYFHEYMHYMQNITTANGINKFIYFIHQLSNMFSQLKVGDSIDGLLYKYKEHIDGNKQKKIEIEEHVDDMKSPRENLEDIRLSKKIIVTVDYSNKKTKLSYESLYGKELCCFYLNSRLVYEGMVHLIQSHVVKGCAKNVPYFPYKVVQNISGYLSKERFSLRDLIRLCDFSLQTSNPGFTFGDCLLQIEKGKTVDSLWDDDIILQDSYQKEILINPIEVCRHIIDSDVFKEAIECAFSGDVRSKISKYLYEVFARGATYRKKMGSVLFSRLLEIDRNNMLNELAELHGELGMPNVFSFNEEKYFGLYAKNYTGAPYLPVLKIIMDGISNKNKKILCPFRFECSQDGSKYNSIYNREICDENFILDVNEVKEFCLAKSVAYSMGLGGVKWK